MGNRPSTARPHPPSAHETSPLARLVSRLTRSMLADSAIAARQAYQLRAIRIDEPLLVVPLTGAKQVRLGGGVRRCEGGCFLASHRAQTLDVENLPAGGHAYRALALSFPWRLVELARTLLNEHPVAAPAEEPITVGALELILPALLAFLEAADAGDPVVADHARVGILLALARQGHGAFLLAREPGPAARIRAMVAQEPRRGWTSAQFEEALHVSGATLRRQLAAEHTSMREVLCEARLHHAIALLQTTRQPVKTVAHASGYRSVPSFRRQFVARFGVEPADLANG